MRFEWPLALLGLVVVPALVALYVVRDRRRVHDVARFGTPALFPNLVDRRPGVRRHLPWVVLVVALAAMVVGVARPHATVSVRREEATVMLVMDVSRSMGANDVRPTRLGAAQIAAASFARKVPKKFRIGVISVATRAVVSVAPTEDRELVESAIGSLKTGEGTALGDGVALAVTLARRQRASDGTVPPTSVLLISDGAQDGGRVTPQAAARRARTQRIPVYTVLLGTADGVVEHTLSNGFREIIRVPPRPDTLQLLARATGGRFFTATNDERLREVYEQLGSRLGNKKEDREVTDLFAGGSAVLLLVGGALSALWFRRLP